VNKTNPKVDAVLRQSKKWLSEFEALRSIALSFPLTEELKWYQACYTLDGKNVVLIHGFKEYCALLFFKGALLKDPKHLMAAPGNTQAGRQLRFSSVQEIHKATPTIKAYIREAIQVEKAGLKVQLKKTEDLSLPEELREKLDTLPALNTAFHALTSGRQRAYIYHFSQPKLSSTRQARVDKCIQQILDGKGLNDS